MKQPVTTFLAGSLFALALFGVAVAGPYEDGQEAFSRADYAAAMRFWRPLADQGNAPAQQNVGMLYDRGLGVTQDYAQAVAWYRRAADQGNALAQVVLGGMYALGHGVSKDDARGVAWIRKGADQGSALAQAALGEVYANGLSVPQDYIVAHMWFNLAAARADDAVTRNFATERRDAVAALMTPAQIAEAQRLAREWTLK